MKKQIINDSAGWYTIKSEKKTVFYTLYTKRGMFTAKAVCDERDEFDVDLGKRLAKLRAIHEMKRFKLEQARAELDIANLYLNEKSNNILRSNYMEEIEALRMSIRRLEEKIQDVIDHNSTN